MTDEQLQAASAARPTRSDLRTLVHAHSAGVDQGRRCSAAARRSSTASSPTDEVLKLMADRGVYFDPNIGLVLQNYIENKAQFLGIGNYNDEGFAAMEKAIPIVTRDVQARAEDAEAEDRLRHRRRRGRARTQHRGGGRPRQGRRAEADGRDRLADVAVGRVAAA